MEENKQYKNTKEFAAAYEDVEESEDESTWGEIFKGLVKTELSVLQRRVEAEIDPFGIWFEPSEREKYTKEILKRWDAEDQARPDIISALTFKPFPKEKASGLKAKFALFAGDWNAFVAEIEAGKVEVAEALLLDTQDARNATSASERRFYAKLADLNGNVLKGGLCVINHSSQGGYKEDFNGWIGADEYMLSYPERSDAEFDAYEAAFWANACKDPVNPDDKKHAYVLHYNFKGTEYYGVIYEDEYNDLKKIKDYITSTRPENFYKYNNYQPAFSW